MQLPHLTGAVLPPLHRVHQRWPAHGLADVAAAVRSQLALPPIADRLQSGMRIAIAVGSRGIANLPVIVRTLVESLRERGCDPFIIPAMGSHGGATAEGQTAVLAKLGISAASAGCPVRSSMDTVRVGGLQWTGSTYADVGPTQLTDLELHADAIAMGDADAIVPVVRVKPHTGFRGSHESGICKMLCIGLGKHASCSRLHREGYGRFPLLIPAAGRAVLASGRIPFALAMIEDAADATAMIEAVPGEAILAREPALLERARALMPRLPFPEIDVLVIERIGKDISGTGMDPNITGRSELGPVPGFTGPRIHRIVVLGLTTAAGGNASGIGLADVITESCFQAIDRSATAINVLTSGSLHGGRLPVAVVGDDQAILAAAACVPGRALADARIVRIHSTLHLSELQVSPNLLAQVDADPGLERG